MADDLNKALRARARLALRGERAFGLRSLPVTVEAAAALAPVDRVAPVTPASSFAKPQAAGRPFSPPTTPRAATPVAPPVAASKNLFGAEPPAKTLSRGGASGPPAEPFDSPLLDTDAKRLHLSVMDEKEVRVCPKCRLCQTRTKTVFGEGDVDAKVFFIGEGPGENEDLAGRPFVGRAGQLLDKMIAGMGLRREQVFIANIVKCRPPGNRVPAPDEVDACSPYLERQLEIVRPKVIVTLGLPAAKFMLKSSLAMGRLRGQWQSWRGMKLMPTFHPAYLLRSYTEENRRAVWSDLQAVMREVGLTAPPPRGKKG